MTPPRPLARKPIMPVDVAPIGQDKRVSDFPLHSEGALMPMADMLHQLGVTEPTIGRDDRRRQVQAALAQGQQARIDPLPSPTRLVPARSSRANGVRSPHDKIDRHYQLAITYDHDQ